MPQRPAVTSYIRAIVLVLAASLLSVPLGFAQGQIAPGGPGPGGGSGDGHDQFCTDIYVYACCNGVKRDASNSCEWVDLQAEGCTARGGPNDDCSSNGGGGAGGTSGGSAGGCSLCGDVCCYKGQPDNGHNCALTGGDCSGGMLVGGKCPGSYCAQINGGGGGGSGSGQSKPPSGGSSSPQPPPGSCTGVACLEGGGAGGGSYGSGGYILKNFNFSGNGSVLAAASTMMKIPPPSNPSSPAGWYSVASSGFLNGIAQFAYFGGVKASGVKALGDASPFSQVSLPKRSKASLQSLVIATSNGSLYPGILVFKDPDTVVGVISSGSRASGLTSGAKKALKGLIDTSSKKGRKVDQAFAMALPKGIGAPQALLAISDPGYRIVSMKKDPSTRAFKVVSMSDTLSPQRVWGAFGFSLPSELSEQLLQVLFVGGSGDLPKPKAKKTKKK